jgi:hypothetical protein
MATATCVRCGREFDSTRSTATFCSSACRQAAYRERKDPGPTDAEAVAMFDAIISRWGSWSAFDKARKRHDA